MFLGMSWKLIGLLAAGIVIVGGGAIYWIADLAAPPHYVTAAVTQGDVVTTITASGSVNPVVVVTVGTYVSGTIDTLNCDYNTQQRRLVSPHRSVWTVQYADRRY
jgi:HlyD family secretion protein